MAIEFWIRRLSPHDPYLARINLFYKEHARNFITVLGLWSVAVPFHSQTEKKKSFHFPFESYVNNLLDLFPFCKYICSLSFNTLCVLFTTKHLLFLCLIKSWRVLRYLLFMLLFFISLTSFSNLHWYSRYTFCIATAAKQIILPLMTALAASHRTPRLVSWFLLILIYSEIVFICCTNAAALIRELLNLHTSDLL